MGVVYLIHFDRAYHHAKHYIGYAANLEKRIERHKKGDGAKLLKAIQQAGIGYAVVRTWTDVDRNFERKLKNRKNSKFLCPVCSHEHA